MGNKNIFIDFIHMTIRRLGIYFQKKKKTLFIRATEQTGQLGKFGKTID